MDVQVVSSQGQNSDVKTDGAFLPRILLSGFLLVSVIGDSASLGLQTSVRRGTSLVYSAPRAAAPRAAMPRCCHSCCAGLRSCAGDPCGSSKPQLEGEPALFTLLRELLRRGAGKTAVPATKVALATRVTPPLGFFCSVNDQNLSESVASSSSLRFH